MKNILLNTYLAYFCTACRQKYLMVLGILQVENNLLLIMHEPVFSFGTEQFNRIFPFYLLINCDSEIASCGKSIAKLQQIEYGTPFADNFSLKSPRIKNADFHSLKELAGQDVTLDFAANNNSLHGKFEFLDQQNQLLFIGGG